MKKNQHGFGAVAGVFVLFLVIIIAGVGWHILKTKNNTATNMPITVAKTAASPKPVATTASDNYVNTIQADGSVKQETPEQIAKTTDEANILKALHDSCSGQADRNVTVNVVVFDGNSNFKQDGTHAMINAGVCEKIGKTLDDVGGSGGDRYLHKNSLGTWIFDATSTGLSIDCKKIDGLGYTTSTVRPTCYDSTTSTDRAPKQ